jgi:hypothetical protein
MDAFTWFKTVFRKAPPTTGVLRAEPATGSWADVPRIPVTVRSWPPSVPTPHDENWDVVIARAKGEVASRIAPSPPPLPRAHRAQPKAPPPLRSSLARQAQAARPASRKAPPRPERDEWEEWPDTPPPPAVPKKIPRTWDPERAKATLDALYKDGLKKPAAMRPPLAARRPAEEDLATPLPVGAARRDARG